jgi:hypothetical protein
MLAENIQRITTIIMASNFVDFSEFSISNLIINSVQNKQSKATSGSTAVNYYEIPLSYNVGTTEEQMVSSFFIQFPEVSTNQGIVKGQQQGKVNYSIPVVFSLQNKEHVGLIKVLRDIHTHCSVKIAPMRGTVGMRNFKAEDSEGTGFAFPLYYPTDKVTGEVIPGRNPSTYLKCKYSIYGDREEKTLFTDLRGNTIKWDFLSNVDMKFIPLIHIEKLYIGGGKIRLQMKLVQAVVTDIVKRGSVSLQRSTIERYAQLNPEKVEALEKQLKALLETETDDNISQVVPTYTNDNTLQSKTVNDFLSSSSDF